MRKAFRTRRVFSIIIAVILLLNTLVSIPIVTAFAADEGVSDATPTITVGSVSGKPGETVDVPVSIANNSGIVSLNVSISYDSSILKLTGVTNGTVLTDPAHSGSLTTNPYKLCFAMDLSPTNVTANGVIATLTFEVLSTATPGDTNVTVDYNPNEIYDFDTNNVYFEKINGKVTIEEPDPIPDPVITVGTASGRPGETVSIPVSIENNSGIVSLNVSISYDSSVLKLTGVTNGTVLTDPAHSGSLSTNPYKLCFAMDLSPTNITANGVIATLTFEILSTPISGEANITVDYDPDEIYDFDMNSVYFEKVNGKITVLDLVVDSISMKSNPTKITYIEGQDLDLTNAQLTVNYDNMTSKDIVITESMVTGYNKNQIGQQTLTVTYGGKTTTFTVTVNAKTLSSIAVTTPPTKISYIEGNIFAKAGMVVTAYYDNGTSEVVTDYTVSPDPLTLGTTQVTVAYLGKTATTPVSVAAKTLQSIAVTTNPAKTSYKIGNIFSAAGGVITLTYDNGSTSTVNVTNAMCSGYDMDSIGNQTVTVTYEGKTASFSINVQDKELLNITIKTQPSQKIFIEGTAFSVDGVITLHYDNDTTEDKNITVGMCSGYNMNQIGNQTVTITESGKTASYQITVSAKTLTDIAVTTPPSKTVYIEGNTFAKAGMVVTAYYDNGTTAVVTDYTVAPELLTLGTTQVTVTYQGKTATTPVTVNAKTLTGISITTPPAKTSYIEGNAFDKTGMVVTASYDNGTSEVVTGYAVDKTVLALGDTEVEVSYLGKTAPTPITVRAKSLERIEIKTQPSQKTFIEGTTFTADGVITLYYDNDTTEDKNITVSMCSGYDMSRTGTQLITITESSKTTSYQITVNAKSVVSIAVTTPPSKTIYIEGNVFDKTGMVVTAIYDNGTSEAVTDYTVSPSQLTLGTTEATITHAGKTTTQPVTVNAKTLQSIAVTTVPTTTTYKVGSAFSAAGGVITLSYDNGSTETVDITNAMCSGYDTDSIGSQTVTVAYEGKTATFNITVQDKELESISIKTQPTKKTFIEGTAFSTDGVITLHYDNDTTEDKDITVGMCSGYDMSLVGTQTVTVTESGKTATYQITINAKSVVSIAVTNPPTKTTYIEGNTFDNTGMIVTATYDNGTSAPVTDYTVTPSPLTLGTTEVTITHAGKTTTQDVTVNAKTLLNIAVTTAPVKTTYKIGSTFSAAGGVITLTYDNGSTETVNITNAMCSGYDTDSIGNQTVTVTYSGKTATFDIIVQDKELTGISIKTQPSQKTFIEGTAFFADGVITLHYDNDTTEDKNISIGMCSGYDMNQVGTQTVTITESGKTATYQITVNAKSAASIAVKTAPTKTTYIEGQDIDLTGAVITVTYDNGTTEDISVTADMISGYSKNTVGSQTVTVTYQGKTATFDITVNAKTLTGITLDISDAQTTYFEGSELDLTGLAIIAEYDNGTTASMAVTADMISGYDKTAVGEQSVTVTYNGETATYTVTVVSRTSVDELIAAIDALNIDNLTADDKDEVFGLKDIYDAMSDFEQEAVTNKDKLDEAVAKINELLNPAVDQSFLDGEVNIKADPGVVPYDATLKVVEKTVPADILAKIKEDYGANSLFIGYYDITLEDADGNKIQPNGILRITIKLGSEYADGKDLVLVYVDTDGKISVVDAKIENGKITFETDHLSTYGVVKKLAATGDNNNGGDDGKNTNDNKGEDSDNPQTGDNSRLDLWIMLMFVSAVSLVILIRKRKALSR